MAITKRRLSNRKIVYQVEVFFEGRRIGSKTFDTKSEAIVWQEETKRSCILAETKGWAEVLVSDVVQQYRTTIFNGQRKSTQQARSSRFRYLLDAPLAALKMGQLDPTKISDWIQWLKTRPTMQNRNRVTFRAEIKLLSAVLRWHIEENDHRFSMPITRKHYQIATVRQKSRDPDFYLTEIQVRDFLAALKKRPDPVYYLLAFCMVLTGLRLGEAAGLCWDAVDLHDKPAIRIFRTLSWDYKTKIPYFQDAAKNSASIRYLKIDERLANALREVWHSRGSPTEGAVFKNKKGNLLSDNAVRTNFNACYKACGLKWTGSHIMRHTFATVALEAKKAFGPVQVSMGHKSQKMTEHYAKIINMRNNDTSLTVADRIVGAADHDGNHVIAKEELKLPKEIA